MTTIPTRQPNSFAWLSFGFASVVISAFIIIITTTNNDVMPHINSIEGVLLGLTLGSIWFFAAFYGIAKGFRRV